LVTLPTPPVPVSFSEKEPTIEFPAECIARKTMETGNSLSYPDNLDSVVLETESNIIFTFEKSTQTEQHGFSACTDSDFQAYVVRKFAEIKTAVDQVRDLALNAHYAQDSLVHDAET
ncbi:unnamed protein product, partial [Allacma fusca]